MHTTTTSPRRNRPSRGAVAAALSASVILAVGATGTLSAWTTSTTNNITGSVGIGPTFTETVYEDSNYTQIAKVGDADSVTSSALGTASVALAADNLTADGKTFYFKLVNGQDETTSFGVGMQYGPEYWATHPGQQRLFEVTASCTSDPTSPWTPITPGYLAGAGEPPYELVGGDLLLSGCVGEAGKFAAGEAIYVKVKVWVDEATPAEKSGETFSEKLIFATEP